MEQDIVLKTSIEVARIRASCRVVARILERIKDDIVVGISTAELDSACKQYIADHSATPAHFQYRGFPGNSCISINHVAAHGVPGDYCLEPDDIVTVDLAVLYNGWYGDAARTFIVGEGTTESRRVVKAAMAATQAGMAAARAGARLGDVGFAIHNAVIPYGGSALKNLVGHGIGQELHEEPMILNDGQPGTGLPIVPGMVFTIEPIITLGSTETNTLDDGWTVVTKDGRPCAQFEHTIAIFGDRTEILTLPK